MRLARSLSMHRSLVLVDSRDPRVEQTWRLLEAQAQPPYFLSWGWIERWLGALPSDQTPPLAVVEDDHAPVAAFFLGRHKHALYFNATGSPRHDELCIEHNGLLAAPGACRSLAQLVELLPPDWGELHLPAIDRYAFDDLAAPNARVEIARESIAPFVDLEQVRNVGYLPLLGASTRSQLRRARRIVGDVEVEVAADEAHAIDIYGELLRLHARRWHARGARGAFADPWFERFHRGLVRERLRHGEIQLVRVRAGGETLGCLYNFVSRGRVLFYQAGLATFDDPHIKAGFLCHAAAIEHNAAAGHAIYDFLGGTTRYKRQLATGESRLVWLRVKKTSIALSIARWLARRTGRRSQPLCDS